MHTRPEHHLLIGDEQDLPLLRALLSTFPHHAVGELYLEFPEARPPALPLPPGLTLTLLPRGIPGRRREPGRRACAALESWVGEWVLGEHARPDRHSIFVGLEGNPLVDRLCEAMLEQHPGLHMHRPCRTSSPL